MNKTAKANTQIGATLQAAAPSVSTETIYRNPSPAPRRLADTGTFPPSAPVVRRPSPLLTSICEAPELQVSWYDPTGHTLSECLPKIVSEVSAAFTANLPRAVFVVFPHGSLPPRERLKLEKAMIDAGAVARELAEGISAEDFVKGVSAAASSVKIADPQSPPPAPGKPLRLRNQVTAAKFKKDLTKRFGRES